MNTKRTPLFLMANLGSEVSQVFLYIEKGNTKLAQSALSRAERIIDELLICPELKGRTKEIEIVRDIIESTSSGSQNFQVKRVDIENYFQPFALRFMGVR